jgi:RNA polymerase sigma factor (sigma-70 family)
MTAIPETGEFTDFYRAKWPDAVRWARALARAEVAEDLAQDAFLNVRRHWAGIEEPTAYLRTAVVNACRAWHRSRSREELRHQRLAKADHASPPHVDETMELLDALSERQRTVLVLRFYLDLDDDTIAETIGCRSSTVRSLAARGLAQLRKEMTP